MKNKLLTSTPSTAYLMQLRPERGLPMPLIGPVHFGKADSCNIQIQEPEIQMQHAIISATLNGFLLSALNSSCKVQVNHVPIQEHQLSDGDQIQIGQQTLLFSLGNQLKIKAMALEISSRNLDWSKQLAALTKMAATEHPILLQGPSGAGKEILAKHIHAYSSRKNYPFICVNCAALSPQLVESELFGHRQGSFTGATENRPGAFLAAHGGTLFLDEIGDLPLELQPKILRALENSEIRAVGDDKSKKVDVRIITATHKNLELASQSGLFREDLYYRIHVLGLKVPALQKRMEDFDDLIYHFGRLFRVAFDQSTIDYLKTHSWPGNIRELKNLVARSSAMFPGQRIDLDHLELLQTIKKIHRPKPASTFEKITARNRIQNFERHLIIERLRANDWQQRATALDLGIAKSTFHDKIKKLKINIKELQTAKSP